MIITKNTVITTFILLSTLLAYNVALAHEGAMGVVKERMELMKRTGKDMKTLKSMVNGKTPYEADVFIQKIESINKAASEINRLFPEGSLQKPTEAKELIWKDWERFTGLSEKLSKESAGLIKITNLDDMKTIKKQLSKVGKVCFSCHKRYRQKKKKK
jgi:cytochrome c556